MNELLLNNQVAVLGEINSGFTFSHDLYGERFYTFQLAVERTSHGIDYIPVLVSERDIDVKKDYIGKTVMVKGQFRSFNNHEDSKKSRLILSVFVMELQFIEEVEAHQNDIFLDGFVCKAPTYRKTPLGREITDLVMAVNRPYGKSDYIPCICWGRNARFASTFEVGEHVQISGRIQSRNYVKKLKDGESENRTAYEVSVCNVAMLM